MSVYEDVKRAIQNLIAPELREMKADIRAINARLESIDRRLEQQHENQKAS